MELQDQSNDLPDEITVSLQKPLIVDGTEQTEITVREPTAGEVREIFKVNGVPRAIRAIAICSGVSETAIGLLRYRDFKKLEAAVDVFFAESPTTGGDT